MNDAPMYLEEDWHAGAIPANVVIGKDVFIETSYGFAAFLSEQRPGLVLGDGSGAYDRAAFIVGPRGRVTVGQYTCINSTYLICNDRIDIGSHCFLAWGAVITDTWPEPRTPPAVRRAVLEAAAAHPGRWLPPAQTPRPVVIEDLVWVGFDAVILPGVTLGHGSVIGSKSIVAKDVPPYAVVVGDPARIVRYIDPEDEQAALDRALRERIRR